MSVRLCLSACSGCGTPFLKFGFGVSTLMFKCLFGSPLVTSMPCAHASTLMFRACSGENARRQWARRTGNTIVFLLHNHWLAVHKVGWNACVTDGLKGEGRPQEPSFLVAACLHKCLLGGHGDWH